MSATLTRLRQDHKNVAQVLNLIEAQSKTAATAGGLINLPLLKAAILYFRQYFTHFHQVKEDLIFGHLLGVISDSPRTIFPLVKDHRELLKRVDDLERGVEGLQCDGPVSREDLGQAAARFVECQRAHLAAEEKFFYPEAERWLSAQHWAEVESYEPDAVDPLSEKPMHPDFAVLVKAITALSGGLHLNAHEADAREAVGVFGSSQDFQMAIDELLSSGFDRADLSLLASAATVDEKLGYHYQRVEALENDQAVPRAAYVSPEAIGGAEGGLIGVLMYIGAVTATGIVVASGGTLPLLITAIAAAGGAGGLIGTILAKWIGSHHAQHLEEQLDKGGLLLWVHTRDAAAEKRAVEILRKHSGADVHVHAVPVA
jgi:hemerythrin-like domain-containing protein